MLIWLVSLALAVGMYHRFYASARDAAACACRDHEGTAAAVASGAGARAQAPFLVHDADEPAAVPG